MNEKLRMLIDVDSKSMSKLAMIDNELIMLELEFLSKICNLADDVDLDRRIALKATLMTMDTMWEDLIMAL